MADNSEELKNDDEKILAEARERFKLAEEAESHNRTLAEEDIKFALGEQWPDEFKQARDRDGRPCLTINRMPQFIQQVTNDQRQNRPSIKVHPVDDHADPETAKIIQGLVRHIEYDSNADVAYDTSFESAVKCGFGYFRVVTDYCDPMSFDQDIKIQSIPNAFSAHLDPSHKNPDGSDANWGFIVKDYSKDEYVSEFSESKLAQKGEWETLGNTAPDWMKDGGARVAEYFYKEFKKKELVLLSNGEVIEKDQLESYQEYLAAKNPEGANQIQVVSTKSAKVPVIKWCKLNGVEILERTDWPGKWIPIIPVYGNIQELNGKRILKGIVRDAKDPQRMLNYWKSAETEAIALAPRAPFIGYAGQFEGFEKEWETANRRNHAYLQVNPKTINGQLVPLPQRQAFEPAVQAITQAAMFAADDLKATTGIYDSSLGAQGNETSGIAIQRRNVQAQTSNFHFMDNLTRSLKHAGRIIVDLIPKIYDSARVVRIIGDEGEQKPVPINQPHQDPKTGKLVEYALDTGKYDVTVDVGPSYASKRQEAVASMLDLTKSFPQLAQFAGDLMVKNMDWPGATEIAERLKKMLPPNLADDDKKSPMPPEVKAQMDQMGQMMDQLTQQLHEAQDKLDNKTLELESRERIEMAKLETQATIELAKLESKESLTLLAEQIAEIDRRTQMLGFNEPFAAHEPEQQEQFPQQDPSQGDGGMTAGMPDAPEPTGGNSPGLPLGENP